MMFPVANRKSKDHHIILHIRIGKFQRYFQSKIEKSHFGDRPWSSLTILNFPVWGPTETTVF